MIGKVIEVTGCRYVVDGVPGEISPGDLVEVARVADGIITPEQRRLIYALIGEVAEWSGHTKSETKEILKSELMGREWVGVSFSDCTKSHAEDFIDELVSFCVWHGVPTDFPLALCGDSDKYVLACLHNGMCAICGRAGEVHHIDSIGMGRDRERYNDAAHDILPLCRTHHIEVHTLGRDSFLEKYHIHGIKSEIWHNAQKTCGCQHAYFT